MLKLPPLVLRSLVTKRPKLYQTTWPILLPELPSRVRHNTQQAKALGFRPLVHHLARPVHLLLPRPPKLLLSLLSRIALEPTIQPTMLPSHSPRQRLSADSPHAANAGLPTPPRARTVSPLSPHPPLPSNPALHLPYPPSPNQPPISTAVTAPSPSPLRHPPSRRRLTRRRTRSTTRPLPLPPTCNRRHATSIRLITSCPCFHHHCRPRHTARRRPVQEAHPGRVRRAGMVQEDLICFRRSWGPECRRDELACLFAAWSWAGVLS